MIAFERDTDQPYARIREDAPAAMRGGQPSSGTPRPEGARGHVLPDACIHEAAIADAERRGAAAELRFLRSATHVHR